MNRLLQVLFCILCLFCPLSHSEANQQGLQIGDIHSVMNQIFEKHVKEKDISQKIIISSFEVFINQFDPHRIYLLQEEVAPYLQLTQQQANAILMQYRNNDFSAYASLNSLFQRAITRSRNLRLEIESDFLDGERKLEPLETIALYPGPFATNIEGLKDRLTQQISQYLYQIENRYGARFLKKEEKEFIADFENNLRRKENAYLYRKSSGEKFSEIEEENLFALHVLKALAQSLDEHTQVMSAEESESFRIDLEKEYSGLGIIFEKRPAEIVVSEVIEGGAAGKSGKIAKGDILLQVDGRPINEHNWREMIENLRGPEESWVELTLQRPDKGEVVVRLQRQPISLSSRQMHSSYETFGNGIIGVITLDSFYRNEKNTSSRDLRKMIRDLERKGSLRGLVLDLRNNTGGYLSEAVRVAGLFITNGIVVISQERDGKKQIYRDIDPHVAYQGPMIVLTSKDTASAAEIVAQALQDYGIAVVVGEDHTYGKGTVQAHTEFDKEGLGQLMVTVGQYYTVSGKSPEGKGVGVDIVLPTLPKGKERRKEEVISADGPEKIPPHYVDSLEDVPVQYRGWYMQYYVPTLQPRSLFWKEQMPLLRKNSEERIGLNKNYQLYLFGRQKEGEEEVFEEEEEVERISNNYGDEDIVQNEAVEILKDMVFIESSLRKKARAS